MSFSASPRHSVTKDTDFAKYFDPPRSTLSMSTPVSSADAAAMVADPENGIDRTNVPSEFFDTVTSSACLNSWG